MAAEDIEDTEFEDDEDDETYSGPFFDYLKSDNGHETISRLIKLGEDIKSDKLKKAKSYAILERWLQPSIVLIIILATSILTYVDKFDSTIGVLFGTLIGYIYGKGR